MAKKLFLALLLVSIQLPFDLLFANNSSFSFEKLSSLTDECYAPPADNFRVTSRGHNFISLAWIPAWSEATHTLTVLIKNGGEEWIHINTFYNINDSTYTVINEDSDLQCMLILATNCTSGEASSTPAVLELDKIIIDLTIGGRIPANPTPIECSDIDISQHWVGFRVRKIGTEYWNLFEVVTAPDRFTVKRVETANPIVAVNSAGQYPILPNEHYFIWGSLMGMYDMSIQDPAEHLIGLIKYTQSFVPIFSAGWCKHIDSNPPWKSQYEFTALKANSTIFNSPGGGSQGFVHSSGSDKFMAQNPFDNNLTVFHPKHCLPDSLITIQMLDATGRKVLMQNLDAEDSNTTFSTESILPGVYFLQIETAEGIQTIKLVKSN